MKPIDIRNSPWGALVRDPQVFREGDAVELVPELRIGAEGAEGMLAGRALFDGVRYSGREGVVKSRYLGNPVNPQAAEQAVGFFEQARVFVGEQFERSSTLDSRLDRSHDIQALVEGEDALDYRNRVFLVEAARGHFSLWHGNHHSRDGEEKVNAALLDKYDHSRCWLEKVFWPRFSGAVLSIDSSMFLNAFTAAVYLGIPGVRSLTRYESIMELDYDEPDSLGIAREFFGFFLASQFFKERKIDADAILKSRLGRKREDYTRIRHHLTELDPELLEGTYAAFIADPSATYRRLEYGDRPVARRRITPFVEWTIRY